MTFSVAAEESVAPGFYLSTAAKNVYTKDYPTSFWWSKSSPSLWITGDECRIFRCWARRCRHSYLLGALAASYLNYLNATFRAVGNVTWAKSHSTMAAGHRIERFTATSCTIKNLSLLDLREPQELIDVQMKRFVSMTMELIPILGYLNFFKHAQDRYKFWKDAMMFFSKSHLFKNRWAVHKSSNIPFWNQKNFPNTFPSSDST